MSAASMPIRIDGLAPHIRFNCENSLTVSGNELSARA